MPDSRHALHLTAMIPARLGSQRLARKNLALLAGKPLIAYAIAAAKEAGVFDRIVVNSEGLLIGRIAKEYGVEFYQRPERLASSSTTSDEVVYDFMQQHQTDVVAWVNPIAPLQPAQEVREVVEHFISAGLDSLITVREEQVHCNFRGAPLNYQVQEPFARTQELEPVHRFVYSLMMWKRATFMAAYERDGHAILCGRTGFFPVGRLASLLVKTEEDLRLCEYLLTGWHQKREEPVAYYAMPVTQ